MMNNPKISVIIPVYNGEKYIEEAIESILAQTYKNVELIVINDGSTDKSFEKIKPYLTLQHIRYIEQKNKGTAAARNAGIRNSSGEYIAFLDHDDLWLPYKLEHQVEYMRENPEIGLVHGKFAFIDKSGKSLQKKRKFIGISGMCFQDLFLLNRIGLVTVLIRRECIQKAGYFDEEIKFCEDYAMWLRISRYFPVGYIDRELSLRRIHESNKSHNSIQQKTDTLKILKKMLQEFPDTWRIVGKQRVKERLFYLTYHLATLCFHSGRYREAVKYFLKAIRINGMRFFLTSLRLLLSGKNNALGYYKRKIIKRK